MAVIASQDFNLLDSTQTFTDDSFLVGTINGALTNGSAVNLGGEGLDFQTFWTDTRDNEGPLSGSESGDFIGVNAFTGSGAPDVAADGTPVSSDEQNFQFNDGDGRLSLVFEPVDISGFSDRTLSFDYWIADTGYESNDAFFFTLSDGTSEQTFLNFCEAELEANASADNGSANWNNVTVNLDELVDNGFGEILTLTINVDTNAGSENIFVDNVLFAEETTVTSALISEFQPNPDGNDPATVTFELSGNPGDTFAGWIVSIENDGPIGSVDRATAVSGTFDPNGLLTVDIPDLENPSFTVVVTDTFTGSPGNTDVDADNDGIVDDISDFGTIFDAIGVPDSISDASTLYAEQLGGINFAYTGAEPELIFRDASVGDLYAVNDVLSGTEVFDIEGNSINPSAFDINPIVPDTFGAINPTFIGDTGGEPTAIAINELRISSPSGSDNDSNFVELFSQAGGNVSLDGLSVVVVSGEFEPGQVDFAFDLVGQTTDTGGFFLIANSDITTPIPQAEVEPTDLIADFDFFGSPATFLIVENFTGQAGDDLDADNDGVFDSEIGTIIDSVSLVDGDDDPDQNYSDTVVGPDGNFTPAGVAREVDGTGNFQQLAFGDFTADTPGFTNVAPPPPVEITPIYAIQGSDQVSPFVLDDGETVVDFFNSLPDDTFNITGDSVTTTGIVTAVDTNGFFLQDPAGDNDIATSDAIFVFTGGAPEVSIEDQFQNVEVGDELQVSGTVSEFFPGDTDTRNLPTTQISGNPTLTLLSEDNTLPETVTIGLNGRVPPDADINGDAFASFDPDTDGIDFFESLEGMRVTAQDVKAVAGTNRFGEIFGVVNQGTSATGISERGTLNISPDDFNPEKVQIDEDSGIFNFDFPNVDVGALLGDVTGVVGYSFGNFEIYPTEDFTANIAPSDLEPEVSEIKAGNDTLTVASYNVLNLDPKVESIDLVDDNDAGEIDDDIGDGRFAAIAQQIVKNLNAPDIIGLQEIQDNDGAEITDVSAANETLQTLVDAIAAAGGPTYEFIDTPNVIPTFIDENNEIIRPSGGQPGGNIRNAFLYNPDRVDLVEDSVQAIGSQAPGETFNGARRPLVAAFEFNGQEITLINNHFSSKGGSAPILGIEQPFDERQEDVDVNGSLDERQAQSAAVQDFVSNLLSNNPDANVSVLGDLNEFEFVSPVTGLEDAGLTNLTNTLPADERYSFIFQGNSQSLDHILVSDSLLDNAEFDIVHTNVEFAETDGRASDHDPLLAAFTLEQPINLIEGSPGRDVLIGTEEDDIITGFQGRDRITTGAGEDVITYTTILDAGDIITDFEVGADRIDLTELVASLGVSSEDAIGGGYVGFRGGRGATLITIDVDGAAGPGRARNFALVQGVELSTADILV